MSPIRYSVRGLLFSLLLILGLTPAQTMAQETLVVGVVPQFSASTINRIWLPLLERLGERTGLTFKLHNKPSIPSFEQAFKNGEFDLVYLNPYHQVIAQQAQGYRPLVRDTGRTLRGVLVVHQDSGIGTLSQLQGKTVAFPAPNALGASLQMRYELAEKHGLTIIPRYVNNHASVYLNVALQQAVAGGGVQKTLDQQSPAIRERLKVIYQTTPVAPHPLAIHPRVDNLNANKVQQALLAMGEDKSDQKLLAQIPMQKIGPASMDDYQSVKDMQLEKYYVSPVQQ